MYYDSKPEGLPVHSGTPHPQPLNFLEEIVVTLHALGQIYHYPASGYRPG